MINKLGIVTVFVSDQDFSVKWYQNVLGIPVQEHFKELKWVQLGFDREGTRIALSQPRPEWGQDMYAKAKSQIGKNTGVIFETDDIQKTVERLKKEGVEFILGPEKTEWGSRSIFTDPDGNTFILVQHPKRY